MICKKKKKSHLFFEMVKKKTFKKWIHIHETNLLCMHHILKRKTLTKLLIPSLKFQNLQFYLKKKKHFSEKNSDLYVMKVHIRFMIIKMQICI